MGERLLLQMSTYDLIPGKNKLTVVAESESSYRSTNNIRGRLREDNFIKQLTRQSYDYLPSKWHV